MNKLLPLDPSSELDLCRGILLKQEQINMRKKYKRLSDNLYMLSFVVGKKKLQFFQFATRGQCCHLSNSEISVLLSFPYRKEKVGAKTRQLQC